MARKRFEYGPPGLPEYLNLPIAEGTLAGGVRQQKDVYATPANMSGRLISVRRETELPIWIEEMSADFSIQGVEAQSRRIRQFYPRAFQQPSLTITGRCANDRRFNEVAEFVRQSQVDALSIAESPLALDIPYLSTGKPERRHRGWRVRGYIENIQAGAQRFNPAPSFQFKFVISYSQYDESGNVGLIQDSRVEAAGREILTWLDVIQNNDDYFSGPAYLDTSGGDVVVVTSDDVKGSITDVQALPFINGDFFVIGS